jgi:threonine dehydrogenase-like Zn-dependent dehydrogenase
MDTMAQLVLTEPGRAQWTDVPVPVLTGDVDALVRPIAVATCDLDTWINAGGFPLPLPYALGHEFVAEVLAVGDSVRGVAVGDVVGVPFQISCGTCGRCARGLTSDCTSVHRGSAYGLGTIGGTEWGGAMADVVRVPYADAMLVPVPPGVSPEVVASLDNIPDGWRTVVPHLADAPEKRVLVVGGVSVGLYAVAVARAFGAEVTYVDSHERRRGIAERLGATVAFDTGLNKGKFPITVNAGVTVDELRLAIASTEPGGVCTNAGIFIGDVGLPLGQMYTRGIRFVTGRVAARPIMPELLALVADGRLDPSLVTATTANWSAAERAWSEHRDKLVLLR